VSREITARGEPPGDRGAGVLRGVLKRAEHEDYYDRRTNFNPFAMKV